MSSIPHDHAAGHGVDHEHAHHPGGIMRWITTTNQKDIGTLYLWFSFIMFIAGGCFALTIRTELFHPGLQIVDPEFFNSLTTLHGLIMIFGSIMPAAVGFANWQVPLMIGAPDMAFARMNNWSFWLLPFAAVLLLSSFVVPGGAASSGWSLYPPLSVQTGMGMDMTIFAIHIMGASSIMGSINIITTILNMRAPGMTMMTMPLTDRHFGTSFFNAAGGGDPVMFQHIFWFFGHPEVYIMILPSFGIVSTIIPAFSRKPLFGYASMVYATGSIAILSFLVWAHHMFTVGMPAAGQVFFMYVTMLIAVPTAVKVFNWVATMWKGSMTFETPMLFAIGFIFMFTVGGFTGLVLALVPVDIVLHDTYYVVAHFHYVLVAGSLFAFFGGIYYWLPKWCGRMYDETLGSWHFWLSFVFFNVTFFPMHFLGLAGMPRRIPDYATQFTDWNQVASVGAFGFGLSQLLLLYIVVQAIRSGEPAPAKPWEGSDTLEWTLPSPVPYHTFETPPHVA